MKHTVKMSAYSMILSSLCLVILFACAIFMARKHEGVAFYTLSSVIVLWAAATLYYAPMSLEISDGKLWVNRSLRCKSFDLKDIVSAEICQPTMGERRLCGSGGFMGYWGWFTERDLGRYFAYYGKAGDCFLVRLRDGRKYMLGCDKPELFVKELHAAMARS